MALPDAPFFCAIAPAVCPLPYFFVWFDEAAACVSCAVVLEGLTPAVGAELCSATVVVVVVVVDVVGAGSGAASFFSCPGTCPEFPGAASLWLGLPPPLPLSFPLRFPFPASAEPANARTPRASTQVPVSRLIIAPLPTAHVSEEDEPVHWTYE
jgi:hypothetical protein